MISTRIMEQTLRGRIARVSCYPKRRAPVRNTFPSLSVSQATRTTTTTTTMLLLSITTISLLQFSLAAEQQIYHRRHEKRSTSSTSMHHHHRHQRSENSPLTIHQCSGDPYPQEFESWMNELTERMEADEDAITDLGNDTTRGQNGSLEEYMAKIREPLGKNGSIGQNLGEDQHHHDSGALDLTASVDPDETWGPNEKLLSTKDRSKGSRFRLLEKELDCPTGSTIKVFHWHPIWDTSTRVPGTLAKHELSNMSLIAEDGNLIWNKVEGERHVYGVEDYCIWRKGIGRSGWVSFKVCATNCSDTNPCVRKCCLPNEVVMVNIPLKERGCIPASQRWQPRFYSEKWSPGAEKSKEQQVTPKTSYIVGFVECEEKYFINESKDRHFKLLLNGTLVQSENWKRTYIKAGEFCIDGVYLTDTYTKTGQSFFPLSEWDQVVVACRPNNTHKQEVEKWRLPMFSTLNAVSAVFLFFTLIVYLLLWRHQNIHGWLQFAYATSLFLTFNMFFVVQRWSQKIIVVSEFLCKAMGWICHLTYLSAFFWLTSMNFDLWWRFSRPLRTTRMTPKAPNFSRFLGFALFSICIPLMISSIGIYVDYLYINDPLTIRLPPFVPGVGVEMCYFQSRQSRVPYLYGPAGILLLIDLVFYASTVMHLRKLHSHTELARTQSTMEDKKGFRVIAKLFVVMGVLWIFETFSWIGYLILPEQELTLIWVFMPIDILNSLQGVAIFVIFVCKPNVGNQLLAMFRTGISKTRFLQLQQSNNRSNPANSSNTQGSNETLFTTDAAKEQNEG